MKSKKHKRTTLLSFLLIIALVLQTPLSAFGEPEPGAAAEGTSSEEAAADTTETAPDETAPEEASDPNTPPSYEGETADPQPVEDTAVEAEPNADEADTGDGDAAFETLAAPDMNGAIVSIASVLSKDKTLDIFNASTQSLARLILWSQQNTPNQRFRLTSDGSGYYTIASVNSNLVLDISGGNATNGSLVIQYPSKNGSSDDNQKWKLILNDDGSYTFLSKLDENFCLDLTGAQIANGTNLIIYRHDDKRSNQRFNIQTITPAVQNGVYTIQSSASTKMLDVSGASFANIAPLISYQTNGGLNQRFLFTYNQQTGYYTIRSVNSAKSLDVEGAAVGSGAAIIQFTSTGDFNQQWRIERASNGADTYHIFAAHNGKSIDLKGGGTADSTPLITWDFHGGDNQKWKLAQTTIVNGGLNVALSNSGLYLDIRGNSENDNADALIYASNGGLNQKFFLKQIGGSASIIYVLECVQSGKLLSAGSATENKVYQYTDLGNGSGNTYQQWMIELAGNASFRLKNVATEKYLDYGAGTNNTNLQIATLGNFSSQAWKFQTTDPLPDGLYTFASALNNTLVFDIKDFSTKPGVPLTLLTASAGGNQTFKTTKLGTGRYSVVNLNSGLALDVDNNSVNAQTGAGKVIQWNPQNTNNQMWKIEYVGQGYFRLVSILQNGRACMTVSDNNPGNGTSVGLLDINDSAAQSFKPIPVGSIGYYQMNCTLDQFVSWQIGADTFTLKSYIDPTNKTGYSFMQFADVRVGTGVTGAQLNAFIDNDERGRSGIFHGRGQSFVDAAKKYGINEVYFLAHANLESNWGTSNFAKGSYYDGHKLSDGKTYPAGTYYNFWGIGAYDSNPNYAIDYAVMHGWSSPEKAIDGSAQWIAENYIYGTYPQPTVYAMRWDYVRTNTLGGRGWHQYATSLTWANSIPRIMNECYDYLGVSPKIYYVVPRFK
ncbi:MAG: RICIN domain-containing protein [Coriobacteriales bacterium]|jgi:beta-N-acetylglucosaminidase|nr:RICIN domain-containing protein [Coriobacteriales bacterium]